MFDASLTFSLVFSAALLLSTAMRLWLVLRQVRHVRQHRAQVPSAYAGHIDLAAHHKAADYTVAKAKIAMVDILFGAVVLLGWTLLGGLDALQSFVSQALADWVNPGLGQPLALVAAFALVGGVLDAPLSAWQTFGVETRFGFNRSTWGMWLADGLKGVAVSALLGLPLLAAVLWLMERAGPLWWLWAWGVFMGFNLLMMVLYPTLIAPLFNRFQPLQDAELVQRVQALMARCGFKASGLFMMDGSRRSAHANAYFTGLGQSKRVVLYDTLMQQLSHDELEAVLAHELGHFHHKHIVRRVVWMALGTLAALATLGYASGQSWFYTGLGVQPNLNGTNSALALLLFAMVVPVFSLFLAPLSSAMSRRHEFEADAYAAAQVPAQHLHNALLKLYRDNASTLTPDPWYVAFHHSHPPASQRLSRLTPSPAGAAA
jgi:STE24 endopeptidase